MSCCAAFQLTSNWALTFPQGVLWVGNVAPQPDRAAAARMILLLAEKSEGAASTRPTFPLTWGAV